MEGIATCMTCLHRVKMSCGSGHAMYCDAHGSSRTRTGLLRVKGIQPGCERYRYTSLSPEIRAAGDSNQTSIFDVIGE